MKEKERDYTELSKELKDAIVKKDIKTATRRLKKIEPNQLDQNGMSPLMVAAANADATLVRLLIARKADIYSQNRDEREWNSQRTAFSYAAEKGGPELLRIFLEIDQKGILLNGQDALGATPLMWAIYRENITAVEYLIQSGANLKQTDHKQRTAPVFAFSYEKWKSLATLLKYGINISDILDFDKNFYQPPQVWVKPLVETIFNSYPNFCSKSLMPLLASSDTYQAIQSLWPDIAFPKEAQWIKGTSLLIFTAILEVSDLLKEILKRTINLNEPDKKGNVALLTAAYNNRLENVRLLLDANADLFVTQPNGNTVFNIAAAKNFPDIFNFVLTRRRQQERKEGKEILWPKEKWFREIVLLVVKKGHNSILFSLMKQAGSSLQDIKMIVYQAKYPANIIHAVVIKELIIRLMESGVRRQPKAIKLLARLLKNFSINYIESIMRSGHYSKNFEPLKHFSLLTYAAGLSKNYLLKIVLAKKAEVNQPDNGGVFALTQAGASGCLVNIAMLLRAGADIRLSWWAFIEAAKRNRAAQIKLLLLARRKMEAEESGGLLQNWVTQDWFKQMVSHALSCGSVNVLLALMQSPANLSPTDLEQMMHGLPLSGPHEWIRSASLLGYIAVINGLAPQCFQRNGRALRLPCPTKRFFPLQFFKEVDDLLTARLFCAIKDANALNLFFESKLFMSDRSVILRTKQPGNFTVFHQIALHGDENILITVVAQIRMLNLSKSAMLDFISLKAANGQTAYTLAEMRNASLAEALMNLTAPERVSQQSSAAHGL